MRPDHRQQAGGAAGPSASCRASWRSGWPLVLACLVLLPGCPARGTRASIPLSSPTSPQAAGTHAPGAGLRWWEQAVVYEIYPRSFQDSDGDGVGDLEGITARLGYLEELGIDAIWITPFYPSPQIDFGYDISDYRAVDPRFGTMRSFERLVAEAHRRKIRVIIDLVLNHTSDQHELFRRSRASRTSPYRDFFIWRDPKAGGPPSNWHSRFERSGWTLDARTGQYYYHAFYREQPDLNWRNPAVERYFFEVARFWLDKGVDGFRLDAVDFLFEDPALRDNPMLPGFRRGSRSEHDQRWLYTRNLPEVQPVLRRLRRLSDAYPDRVLISEAYVPAVEALRPYYGEKDDGVHLPFNFFLLGLPGLDAAAAAEVIERSERMLDGRPTTWVLSNHDRPRSFDKFGDGVHDQAIAKLMATLLLTLRGTPFIYYGEELGIGETPPASLEQVRDPVGRRWWPEYKGRDGYRTPMQWSPGRNAGFSTGTPWLWLSPDFSSRNVESQRRDPASLLSYYRRALQLRRRSPALLRGRYRRLGSDRHVLAYERRAPGEVLLVALNMSGEQRSLALADGSPRGYRVVLGNLGEGRQLGPRLSLAPFEAVVLQPLAR